MNPLAKSSRKYATVLRPLTEQERDRLRVQLQQDGLLNALIRDQHGDLLDGYHREDMCQELGIELRYQIVTTNDPIKWIKEQQLARRNLNREEMDMLTKEQIIATPQATDRAIAERVGVSPTTVGKARSKLVADGKVGNVVRLETNGRLARGSRSYVQVGHKDQSERSRKAEIAARQAANKTRMMAEAEKRFFSNPAVQAASKPVPKPAPLTPEERLAKYGQPPALKLTDKRLVGFADSLLYHFADDGEFHSIDKMIKMLDPDGALKMTPASFHRFAHDVDTGRRKDVYMETQPSVGRSKNYRFYRQEKTIGLTVLEAKFAPVIAELKRQADLPISHQSSGQFLYAAGVLIQLLRDLKS